MSKNYYRIRAGSKNAYAEQCYQEGWIGGDWCVKENLSQYIDEANFEDLLKNKIKQYNPNDLRGTVAFNKKQLHQICKDIQQGDIILCDNGEKGYFIGTITSDYYFADDANDLRHRRKVSWGDGKIISREVMSLDLQNFVNLPKTVCNITKFANEIDGLPSDDGLDKKASSSFAKENQLETCLIDNWTTTELGKKYDIIDQQYKTDAGTIDILAFSKDETEYLVIELKKGKASDNVVGQILGYIGSVRQELAEDNQTVRGCIIAHKDSKRIQYALEAANVDIDFYQYEVSFDLKKPNPS